MSSVRSRTLVCLLLVALAGCRGPGGPPRPVHRRFYSDPTHSWFGTTFGVVDRPEGGELRDGLNLGLTIGQDLMQGSVRPSIELQLDTSHHRRRSNAERVELWRVGFGGRLSVDWPALGATPYVHAGIFHRGAESREEIDPLDLESFEGSGVYTGAGLLFWTGTGAVGPFARLYRDEEDNEEWAYGIAGMLFL